MRSDIKPDNILVKISDTSAIDDYLRATAPPPAAGNAQKAAAEPPFPTQPIKPYYFRDGANLLEFDVALGDWGVASWTDRHLTELIQPVALRSPEVLVGAPWGPKTDLWNLGAVVLEVFRAVRLFSGRLAAAPATDAKPGAATAASESASASAFTSASATTSASASAVVGAATAPLPERSGGGGGGPRGRPRLGPYELCQHVREIVHHFGPFPRHLLERGDAHIVRDVVGFDTATGRVRGAPPLDAPPLESDEYMGDLAAEPRAHFVAFLRALMIVDPDARKETMELLAEPWLDAVKS